MSWYCISYLFWKPVALNLHKLKSFLGRGLHVPYINLFSRFYGILNEGIFGLKVSNVDNDIELHISIYVIHLAVKTWMSEKALKINKSILGFQQFEHVCSQFDNTTEFHSVQNHIKSKN